MVDPNLQPDTPQSIVPENVSATGPVSLAPEADSDNGTGPINLSSSMPISATPPTHDLAVKRGIQFQYGLGPVLKKPDEEVFSKIASGNEEELRQQAASVLNEDLAQKRQGMVQDYLVNKKEPLTLKELETLNSAAAVKYQDFDPRDVVEQAYAHNYISTLDTAKGFMEEAGKEIPEQIGVIKDKGNTLTTKLMFARTLRDDVDNEIHNQSYLGWGADIMKQMFQPYSEYKLRGNVEGVGTFSGGLFLGDNLERQATELMMLPKEQFKDRLTDVVTNLRKDNPQLARKFLDYVIGVSASDRILENVFTMVAPADYLTLGKLGVGAYRKISVYNRANNAVKDMIRATENLDKGIPDAAVAAEGAGNIPEAVVQRGSKHIVDSIDNKINPIDDVKESLTSNFRLDGEAYDRNPGKLSRENFTRIKDSFSRTGDSLFQAVTKAMRVQRTPVPLASEDAIRAYQEAAKTHLPGLENTILDIGSPRLEPASGTYHVDFHLGNLDGNLFSNPETAAAYARARGFPTAKVVEATGDVEVQPSSLAGGARDLERKPQLERELRDLPNTIRKWQKIARSKKSTAEEVADAKQQVQFFKETQTRYKADLDKINSRITKIPARIEQNGAGYSIVVTRPYRETDEVVRKFLLADPKALSTASKEGLDSWKNAALGWIRGANDTLSYNETVQRLKATYAQSVLEKWAKAEAEKLSDVAAGLLRVDEITGKRIPWYLTRPRAFIGKFTGGNRKMFEEFNETLNYARTAEDPITGEVGYFFKNNAELEDHYQRWYQRLPTYPEYEAYFAHVKLTEGDRVFREVAEFRNRARVGTEQHQIFFKNEKGERTSSGFFDAIQQSEFPGGRDQILVMGATKGEEKLYRLGGLDASPQTVAKWKEDVKTGRAKVFRIYDPDSHPLSDFSDVAGNERVRYVLATDTETKPLEFNHVPRRGGGHFEYDYDHYVKQARVIPQQGKAAGSDKRRTFEAVYVGDTTLSAVENRMVGKDFAKRMNEVQRLIRENKLEEAEAYVRKNMPVEWDEVQGWFSPSRGPGGKIIPPRFSLDAKTPFQVVPKNRKIYDLDKELENRIGSDIFVDGTKSGSDAQQFQVAYTMQRDAEGLKAVHAEGSQQNPVFKWVPAKMLDPIPTMNRALRRAINSTFMDDYKIYAVEHWLAEATPHMKASESEIRSAPFYYFNTDEPFKSGASKDTILNLKSNKQKIQQFVGMPNTFDTWVHSGTQHLVDAFYNTFGPEEGRSALTKAATIAPTWLLSKVKDPLHFLRSVTFNAKLGFFNPVQFIVQAQTHANIVALEPRHGTVGTFGALLHQWSRVNKDPAIMNMLDDLYTKMNMFGSKAKPGEFIEANKYLADSGFANVGGEYAMSDDAMQSRFIKNDWGNFLDAGQMFFKEGERSPRLAAWYASFRKFREKNPTGPITRADLDDILTYADTMTVNMSRASVSNLHTGVLAPSTQFLSYQMRQAELFWGKRLADTTKERMLARGRLAIFYAGLYGIPSAVGISGMPFTDSIRRYAAEHGYVVGDQWLSSLAMEGVPFMLTAMATGGGDIQKGEHLNFGGRFGQQGFTQMNEIFSADASLWKIVGGPGGGVISNTWASLNPFWRTAKSLMSPDEDDNMFRLTASDFVQPLLGEISTYSGLKRMIIGMNTGRWLNRNEKYIEDVTGKQAIVRFLTGLSSSESETVWTQANIKAEEAKIQKQAKAEAMKYFQRGVRAQNAGDWDTSKQMFKNVRAILIQSGLNQNQIAEIMADAANDVRSQIQSSDWSFGTKNVPQAQQEIRQDRLRRQELIRQKQGN